MNRNSQKFDPGQCDFERVRALLLVAVVLGTLMMGVQKGSVARAA